MKPPKGSRMSELEIARARRLRYEDGLSSVEVGRIIGRDSGHIRDLFPGRPGKISNAETRSIFLASGMSANAVAVELGWMRGKRGDTSRLKRTLGINGEVKRGRRYYRTSVDAETLGLIAEACGAEAWEAEAA